MSLACLSQRGEITQHFVIRKKDEVLSFHQKTDLSKRGDRSKCKCYINLGILDLDSDSLYLNLLNVYCGEQDITRIVISQVPSCNVCKTAAFG